MKTSQILFLSLILGASLSSCNGISHVTDDDVYVLKSPVLPADEAVNDESTYESYRYRRDRGDFDVHYGNYNRYWLPTYVRFGTYSAFNDPFYYPNQCNTYGSYGIQNGYYNNYYGYGTNHCGCGNNYYGYNNYGYYNNGFYNNYYGNGYYNNSYNGKGTGNGSGAGNYTVVSSNFHSGPRNSVSGISVPRRSSAPGMKGMMIQGNNTKNRTFSSTARESSTGRRINTSPTENKTHSRPVEEGKVLSRPGTIVNSNPTSSANRRGTEQKGSNSQPTRSSNPTHQSSPSHDSRPSQPTMRGGNGSGSSSPSPAKTSPTPSGRRGG